MCNQVSYHLSVADKHVFVYDTGGKQIDSSVFRFAIELELYLVVTRVKNIEKQS